MDPALIAVIAGSSAFLAVLIQHKRGSRTAVEVLPILRDKGPLTIPEIMEVMNVSGMNAQGKIVFALDALVRSGKVAEGEVPRGTPQLQKIKLRKYTALVH